MKRLGTGALVSLAIVCCALAGLGPTAASAQGNTGKAVVAQMTESPSPAASTSATAMPAMPATAAPAPAAPAPPPADFGSPPSGAIPILYNDHHVYAKPDTLRHDRVLAALVRGNTVFIPLRSMFEQMGATVSYNAGTRTVTVSKPGATVEVTVGKPEVVINGETRPLDVPPMMYHGIVLVPVRVISEGMGAYVLWVQDQHIVVVRYVVPTPPPPPPPPPSAAPPAPPPPPTPAPHYNEVYIAGDYIIDPAIYNEFSPGNKGNDSYALRGAIEFNTGNIPWMISGDWRHWQYPHDCAAATDPECFVNNIGGIGNSFVPAFTARDTDWDAQLGVRVLQPRMYIGLGYLWRSNNYGYPSMKSWGIGGEKLPDLDHPLSVYGSIWYYPNVQGFYANSVSTYKMEYRLLTYQLGLTYDIGNSPLFIEGGWIGEHGYTASFNDPSPYSENGPYAGIGLRFIY